jgi:hypothetical protein
MPAPFEVVPAKIATEAALLVVLVCGWATPLPR